jgi:hypothetical protein
MTRNELKPHHDLPELEQRDDRVVLNTTHSLTCQHWPYVVVLKLRITESASHSSRRDRRASSASIGGRPVCTAQLRSAITQVNQVRSLFRLISAGSIWGSPMNALGFGEFSPISTPIRTESCQPQSLIQPLDARGLTGMPE